METHFARILEIMCLKNGDGYTLYTNIGDYMSQGRGWIHILREYWRLCVSRMAMDTHYTQILEITCLKNGDGYTLYTNIGDNVSQEWRWIHILREYWRLCVSRMGMDTHFTQILEITCLKDGDGYTFCINIGDYVSQEWRWIHIIHKYWR
jgi:hypothetical protein